MVSFQKLNVSYNKDADKNDDAVICGVKQLVNEGRERIGIWAIGTKSGISKFNKEEINAINNFIGKGGIILYNCMSGSMVCESTFKVNFFAYMFLDADISKYVINKNLNLYMNHSMMVRSMPGENGFFFEPNPEKKEFDYSITTWAFDNMFKRFDRAESIIDVLAKNGFRGQLFLSRNEEIPALPNKYYRWQDSSLLQIYPKLDPIQYYREHIKARIGIFPNTIDAFPKALIENILTDKYVVVSNDLLIGRSTITPEIGYIIDFEAQDWEKQLLDVLRGEEKVGVRASWLRKYNFEKLSNIWAREINRLLNTEYQQVFYEYHINRVPRVDRYYEYITLK